jgi:hypothetical protein
VQYRETVQVPDNPEALQLYASGLAWLGQAQRPLKGTVQSADRLSATLRGQVRFPCTQYTLIANEGYFTGQFLLVCHRGSYTYTVSRLVWTSTQTSRSFPAEDLLPESRVAQDNKRMARKTSEEMDRQLHAGIEQLKAAMLRRVN